MTKPLDPRKARLRLGLTLDALGRMLGYQGEHVRQQMYEIENGTKPLMACQQRLLAMYVRVVDAKRFDLLPDDWPATK